MIYYLNEASRRNNKYSSKIPSNVFITDNIDFKIISKYPITIIGEIHGRNMIKFYDNLLSIKRPEYLICEFADNDRCLTRKDIKLSLDNCTDGTFEPNSRGEIVDWCYNRWIYELAYKHNCKVIGCDPSFDSSDYSKMQDEFTYRENNMIRILKEFEGKKAVVQLGDAHLRSIPWSKEFNNYCGKYSDDRGTSKEITVDFASPIWEHFTNNKNACICRVRNEYENELNFLKSKGL